MFKSIRNPLLVALSAAPVLVPISLNADSRPKAVSEPVAVAVVMPVMCNKGKFDSGILAMFGPRENDPVMLIIKQSGAKEPVYLPSSVVDKADPDAANKNAAIKGMEATAKEVTAELNRQCGTARDTPAPQTPVEPEPDNSFRNKPYNPDPLPVQTYRT